MQQTRDERILLERLHDDYTANDSRVHTEKHSSETRLGEPLDMAIARLKDGLYTKRQCVNTPAIDLLGILFHCIIVDDPFEYERHGC